jgi:oligoendopeptidase F
MFKKEGAAFLPKYEELLRFAGSGTSENVVKRTVDRDIEATEFWTEAIQSLEQPLNHLENLLPKVFPNS